MKQIKTTVSKLYNALLLIRRLKGITDHMLHVLQVPLNISNTQDIEMVNEKLDDALETLEALLWLAYTLFLSSIFFSAGLFSFVLLFLFDNEIICGSLFCCDILLEGIFLFIYSYPEVLT